MPASSSFRLGDATMATPTFINFSRFEGDLFAAVERVHEELCPPFRSVLVRSVFLRPSAEPYDGGLEAVGEQEPCKTLADVQLLAGTGRAFGLVYLAADTRAEFHLAFHDITKEGFTITGSVESSLVYFKDDEHSTAGQWFESWLIALVTALRPSVCAYGNTYLMDPNADLSLVLEALRRPRYVALDPADVLARLRKGDLLELPSPVFHAISTSLTDRAEIDRLMKQRPCAPRLAYKLAPEHHVLSNML